MNGLELCAISHRGHVRRRNEDAFLVGSILGTDCEVRVEISNALASPIVCAVADGMGGHEDGNLASREALAWVAMHPPVADGPEDNLSTTAWNVCILDAHAHLQQNGDGGTTLTGVSLSGGSHLFFHAGDSRLYRLREARLHQMTIDDRLPAENVVTNGLGAGGRCVPSIETSISIEAGDALLLCTDGLWSVVADDAIALVMERDESASERARALVALALAAGAPDNVTVIVAQVGR